MDKILLILLALSGATRNYRATNNIGFDYLGLARYSILPPTCPKAIGTLDVSFGDPIKPLSILLSKCPSSYLRIHMLNGSCLRLHSCQRGDPLYSYTQMSLSRILGRGIIPHRLRSHIRAKVTVFKLLAESYPKTRFLISPILEHNLSKKAWRVLASSVKATWPGVQLVNNALNPRNAERYRGAKIESHSDRFSGADIYSLDGTTNPNISEWLTKCRKSKAISCLFWTERFNCKNSDKFIAPKARTACPTTSDFKNYERIIYGQ